MAAPRVHVAEARGDVAEVRRLVDEAGPSIHETRWESNFGVSPLHVASAHGRAEAAKALLRCGAREAVERRDAFGNTALHDAAFHGTAEVAAVLLAAGADANARNVDGRTPLHKVAAGKGGAGAEKTARLLIKHGADANLACGAGRTPLHVASFKDRWRLVSLLISRGGADPAMRAGGAGNAAAFAARGRARRAANALAGRTGRTWRATGGLALLLATTTWLWRGSRERRRRGGQEGNGGPAEDSQPATPDGGSGRGHDVRRHSWTLSVHGPMPKA